MSETGSGVPQEDQTAPVADVGARMTAGRLLAARREDAGLHLAALAATLKVPLHKLQALEDDRYDTFDDIVFLRALASSVCRVLKMDAGPVLALLPDSEIKLVFFVPEAEMARYRPGRTVRFSCDGCAREGRARIAWVSPRPEFTPPVLYSRGSRDRLVYRVEARPEGAATLNPGLPVDVVPLQTGE